MEETQEQHISTAPPKTKSKTPVIVAVVLIAIVAGGIAYSNRHSIKQMTGGSKDVEVQGAHTTMTAKPTAAAMEATQAAEQTFTVTGANFSFDPATITVKKGDKVKIVFKNAEGFHDWNLDEFNAHTQKIKANAEDTVEFTADKTGTFEYYCSVGQHRAMGMKGNFIVQ